MNDNYIKTNLNDYSNLKDEDLIQKIKSGDNEALNYLLNN